MVTSLALIFLVGLAAAALCQKIKLPRIIGMLFVGILLGPYALNLLDDSILGISADLRRNRPDGLIEPSKNNLFERKSL